MASTDAKPVPQKNVAYRITFPIFDADGDLVTGAAGLDSEVSKDGGAFADCTNEATEIATSSGMYYLDLTSTEMNADTVAIIVKTSTSGAKTTPIVLYPEEAGDIRVNVTAFGGTAGTFSGGRPEVNTSHIAGSAVSTSSAQIGVNVVNAGGTAWGSGAITAASIATNAIDDDAIAADVTAVIATAVWNAATASYGTAGTYGALVETNLDAAVSTRASQTSVDTVDDFLDTEVAAILAAVDTEVAAIKAKTDNLPAAPAATGDIPSAATVASQVRTELATELANLNAPIATVDTVVNAIKAKTDSLTFTVAGQVDANIQYVNDVLVNGDGSGTPWGP